MTKRMMRGVQDIRTHSGHVDEGTVPYKTYMKLSILEMEKFRRGQEKQSALERVCKIDRRLLDIEVEIQKIFCAMEEKGIKRPRPPSVDEPPAMMKSGTGPFKIKY